MSCIFQRYLISMTIVGGGLGLTHGIVAAPAQPEKITEHALTGALLAPWAPVLVPVYATRRWPEIRNCPKMSSSLAEKA
jgi:hypothetical protein